MSKISGSDKPPKLRLPEAKNYDVGYGKPPAPTRFQKGTSGNPKGRPRGRKNAASNHDIERLRSIIKAEAYRAIRVPEGSNIIAMTMAEAVVRSIAVNAAKGQARAQKLFTELLHVTDRAEAILHNQYLEAMVEYKVDWERELARRAAAGISVPDPVPHPDDIIIDVRTGRAWVDGPVTAEEKANWDRMLSYRDDLQQEFMEEIKLSKKRASREFWREHAAFTQHLYDRINGRLPPRYQKPLEGRLYLTLDEQEALAQRFRKSARRK
jgi:hypothetical protein